MPGNSGKVIVAAMYEFEVDELINEEAVPSHGIPETTLRCYLTRGPDRMA